MLKPLAKKHSANYYQVALLNWARIRGVEIGKEGHAGFSLYVDSGDQNHTKGLLMFVIERRGPEGPAFRITQAFSPFHRDGRKTAFAWIVDHYQRLAKGPRP